MHKILITIMVTSTLLFSISPAAYGEQFKNNCALKLALKAEPSERPTLIMDDVSLIPLKREHATFLRELFWVPDVRRFYLDGLDPDFTAESILLRSLDPKGSRRNSFDGFWVIQHEGQNTGLIFLSRTTTKGLPSELATRYPKTHPHDLYLVTGYALHPTFRGRGLVSKALHAVIQYGRDELKAKYIFASADIDNSLSHSVLIRGGFEFIPDLKLNRLRFIKDLT